GDLDNRAEFFNDAGEHARAFPLARSGSGVRRHQTPSDRRGTQQRVPHRSTTYYLPSGLSPSVPEFHRFHQPMASTGSRTVTAGSDFHRPRSTRVYFLPNSVPRRGIPRPDQGGEPN